MIIVVLAVLLLAMPGFVAARGGNGGGGHDEDSFNLQGTIGAYDCDAGSVDVEGVTPDYLPDSITVYTTADTRFRQCDKADPPGDNCEPIDCTQLVGSVEEVPGWDVRVMGVVDSGTYYAERIIQYVP